MPLRNRVDPFGALHAVSERGDLMGNRDCLHDDAGNIVRHHRGKAWVACTTLWPGSRRQLMTPGCYTELFFRDEATALAAGHVPCGDCRRSDARRFKALLGEARGLERAATSQETHAWLHAERANEPIAVDDLGSLCTGVMVGTRDRLSAWLIWNGTWRPWSFGGYGPAEPPKQGAVVLTTPSFVDVNARGYIVAVHASVL